MKTLVTHIRPHLDDICALWLLVRYHPAAQGAGFDFIPTDKDGGSRHDDNDTICVGVGRGRFDEHKGDIGDCATTLVFKEILAIAPPEANEIAALKKIVDWTFQVDTGKLKGLEWQQFTVPAVFDGYYETHGKDSEMMTVFGFDMLDALLRVQRDEVDVERAWENRIEFDTPWGRGAGLVSDLRSVDSYGYSKGMAVVAIVNRRGDYHTIRADAKSDSDLTPAYEYLKKIEPDASWYFHHSKKMLICGGTGGTAASQPSRLDLEGLIALIRKS